MARFIRLTDEIYFHTLSQGPREIADYACLVHRTALLSLLTRPGPGHCRRTPGGVGRAAAAVNIVVIAGVHL